MDDVEGFLKVNLIYIHLPLPFSALFDDVAWCKVLICASPLFPKACLFLPHASVDSILDPLDGGLGKDLAWYRQQCNATPVVAVAESSLLWYPDDDTLSPISWHFLSLPYSYKKWLQDDCCELLVCLEELCVEVVVS